MSVGQSVGELKNIISENEPERRLEKAILAARNFLGNSGAARVHGGGFAGTVQAFVPFEILEKFREGIDSVLGEGACHVLDIRPQGGVEMEA